MVTKVPVIIPAATPYFVAFFQYSEKIRAEPKDAPIIMIGKTINAKKAEFMIIALLIILFYNCLFIFNSFSISPDNYHRKILSG